MLPFGSLSRTGKPGVGSIAPVTESTVGEGFPPHMGRFGPLGWSPSSREESCDVVVSNVWLRR